MKNDINRSRLVKRLLAVIINVSVVAATYIWLYHSKEWVGNLLKFYAGYTLLFSMFCFSKTVKEELRKNGRTFPQWGSKSLDLAMIIPLAACGHFALAAAFTFASFAEEAVFATTEK